MFTSGRRKRRSSRGRPFSPRPSSCRSAVLFAQADDGLGGGSGLLGGLGDATQEEAHPALPPAVLPYGAEAIVVLGPVALQVVAYVEERSVQDARVDELEGDEEPAHAPVTIQEGVDGLELRVHKAAVD
jgi:hypothetical protein